jgi:phage terminase large subunit-like protein
MMRSEKIIAFIHRYCLVPEGTNVGKPIVLYEFQKKFIRDVYDNPNGTRVGILSVGRKNGKTALIACLLLAHLVGSEAKLNSQIASGAMSKENAALVFKLSSKMINLSPELSKLIRIVPSLKELYGLPMNTEYKALAKDGATNMGGSPSLLILDETGQVIGSQDDFIDAVITSQGAHEAPLRLVISTQAANDSDLLSIWIDDALTGKDPQTICHLYAAPQDADVLDEKAWQAANPALGKFRNLGDMKKMANDASRMPSFENTFRNLYLNQRISVNSPFISRNAWVACADEPCPIEECDEVYGGLDLSGKTDLTSLVLYGHKNGLWNAYPYFWTPAIGLEERSRRDRAPYDVWHRQGYIFTTPNATVDYDFVAKQIGEIVSEINLVAIAYDRWRIDLLKKELDAIGVVLPLVDFGQGFKDMSPALEAIEGKILNKTLRHGAHPVLTMCANNSMVTRNPAGDRKLEKMKTSGRIDGMAALAMAAGIAEREHEKQGAFGDFLNNPLVL